MIMFVLIKHNDNNDNKQLLTTVPVIVHIFLSEITEVATVTYYRRHRQIFLPVREINVAPYYTQITQHTRSWTKIMPITAQPLRAPR